MLSSSEISGMVFVGLCFTFCILFYLLFMDCIFIEDPTLKTLVLLIKGTTLFLHIEYSIVLCRVRLSVGTHESSEIQHHLDVKC